MMSHRPLMWCNLHRYTQDKEKTDIMRVAIRVEEEGNMDGIEDRKGRG